MMTFTFWKFWNLLQTLFVVKIIKPLDFLKIESLLWSYKHNHMYHHPDLYFNSESHSSLISIHVTVFFQSNLFARAGFGDSFDEDYEELDAMTTTPKPTTTTTPKPIQIDPLMLVKFFLP